MRRVRRYGQYGHEQPAGKWVRYERRRTMIGSLRLSEGNAFLVFAALLLAGLVSASLFGVSNTVDRALTPGLIPGIALAPIERLDEQLEPLSFEPAAILVALPAAQVPPRLAPGASPAPDSGPQPEASPADSTLPVAAPEPVPPPVPPVVSGPGGRHGAKAKGKGPDPAKFRDGDSKGPERTKGPKGKGKGKGKGENRARAGPLAA